ncbi:MAG: photosystem II assembly protein Psb35 [Leptolyngbyaceae cyanobacterium]
MYLLLQASEAAPYSISLGLVIAVGFAAAVGIGSVAWYNSKRPAGWEGKERPDVVPKIEK